MIRYTSDLVSHLSPKTGRQMVFPPTNRPMFKGSKEFRKMMNTEKHIKPAANPVDLLED